jgi:hypothetical protein
MGTMTDRIYDHICANPGVTNVEIATALKLDATRVAALTGQMCKPTARAPRVTICGLLPQQAGMISSEFGQHYDLSFWKDESIDRLKSLCKSADHIITFSGKLGHHVENTIKSTNREFKRVMGGMTELRRTLNELGS